MKRLIERSNMKRLILAALAVALAIALAAPAAMGQYPKPPRWTQAEHMYWNNNVTLRNSIEYSGMAAAALSTEPGEQGRIYKELLIDRGDDLKVGIKAKGDATRNARLWFMLDRERVVAKQNFKPGLHYYWFEVPNDVRGIHRITLHTENLGRGNLASDGSRPLIVDVIWTLPHD
jgi:hypothetical protein